MKKKIAVLMTVHNRKEGTLNCISHFYANTCIDKYDIDFYMVDDGSTDGTSDAVREHFPQVIVLSGDGSLFWNRGMYFCWTEAIKTKHDFYLWLNDDTILYDNALESLMRDYENSEPLSVITGCCCDKETESVVTYGGSDNKRTLVAPNGRVQEIFMMNGNCVLIPNIVCERIGIIDPYFQHKAGDNEYGYRAQNNGVKTYVSSNYIGVCDRHDTVCKSYNPEVPLKERLKHAKSPLGPRPKELFYLYNKSFGLRVALKKTFMIYCQILFPTATTKFLSSRGKVTLIDLWHNQTDKFITLYYRLFSVFPVKFDGYILMYHVISDEEKEGTCNCSVARFKNQIQMAKEKGVQFLPMDDAFSIIKENRPVQKFAVVSFDDASDTVFKNAFPVLLDNNIPFIVYLATDLIGKEGFLNEMQIKEMITSGLCTIGSHGVSHRMMSKLEETVIEEEMRSSKSLLEKTFGVKVNHFAYPYGKKHSVGKNAVRIVKEYYVSAVTSIPVKLNKLSHINKYKLGRIVPEFNNDSFLH